MKLYSYDGVVYERVSKKKIAIELIENNHTKLFFVVGNKVEPRYFHSIRQKATTPRTWGDFTSAYSIINLYDYYKFVMRKEDGNYPVFYIQKK